MNLPASRRPHSTHDRTAHEQTARTRPARRRPEWVDKALTSLMILGLLIALALMSPGGAAAQVIDDSDRPAEDQITRLYQAVFGRAPDDGGFAFWNDRYRESGSLAAIAEEFAASPEFLNRYGLDPTDEELVAAMYRNVLDRDGDAGGVAFWLEQLRTGAVSQIDLLVAFAESPENIERTSTSDPLSAREAELLRLYRSAFGRFPDAGGFAFWMGEYSDGTPLRDIAMRFAQSPEFISAYGESPRPADLVDRLYRNVLGRAGDAGGAAFWQEQYEAGWSIPEMLVAFAESDENLQRTGTVPNPATSLARPESITESVIDAIDIPRGTCGLDNGHAGEGFRNDGRIGFVSEPIDGFVQILAVAYADLDDNGATDAVVVVSCPDDADAVLETLVWLAGEFPQPLELDRHIVIDPSELVSLQSSRTDAGIAPETVLIDWIARPTEFPKRCCRSFMNTEVRMVGGEIMLVDTAVNGPAINAVRVITAASTGGPLPDGLPVDEDTWDELVEWLDGSAAVIDSHPCVYTADANFGSCSFATPGSPLGHSIFLDIDGERPDGIWWVDRVNGVTNAN